MGCQQCLPLSVVQLKGKHCRKPHCRNGVVDTFEQKEQYQQKKIQRQGDFGHTVQFPSIE